MGKKIKEKRGGKRNGSGRKKETEERKRFTKLVPISKYKSVKELVNNFLKREDKTEF